MIAQPFYEDESVTLHHADCREVISTLPPVDLILTDPPYGTSYVTGRRTKTDPLRKPIKGDEDLELLARVWPEALACLRIDRHWYVFGSSRRLVEMESILNSKQCLVWDKGDSGTVGDLTASFAVCWEALFFGMKGRRPLNGSRPRSVIRYDWSGQRDPVHPAVKPVGLLKHLIRCSTQAGEVVLDPFAGSGTTLMAAKELGRRSIGIEIDEGYCRVARERLSQCVLAMDTPSRLLAAGGVR